MSFWSDTTFSELRINSIASLKFSPRSLFDLRRVLLFEENFIKENKKGWKVEVDSDYLNADKYQMLIWIFYSLCLTLN